MQKIEVIVRITKDHCPPQEQTIFEWIETNRAAPDTLNYPGLEINLEHRRVFKNGQEVYMSRYEYGVLSLMARHPGQLFTKEQIFEAVWHQDSESCLTAVTNTIGRIRQKIEDDRAVPVYIRTISNLGYQFMPNISVKKDSFYRWRWVRCWVNLLIWMHSLNALASGSNTRLAVTGIL